MSFVSVELSNLCTRGKRINSRVRLFLSRSIRVWGLAMRDWGLGTRDWVFGFSLWFSLGLGNEGLGTRD